MAEETIWTGSSSQLKNTGAFATAALAGLGVIAAAIFSPYFNYKYYAVLVLLLGIAAFAFWKWLRVQSREFRLTTERILISEGIFSKTISSTELYRVKDLRMTQPFFYRLMGFENIELLSSDKLSPDILIDFIPRSIQLGDKCRTQIEACRVTKGTREVELE